MLTGSQGRPELRRRGRVVLLALAVAAVALALQQLPPLRAAENWLQDLRLAAFSPSIAMSPDIVVLAIDEATLAMLPYRTPVDRGLLADVVEHLNARGVRAIGIDLLFDQATEPAKDARLRGVLAASQAPVVVASADTEHGLTRAQAAFLARYTEGLMRGPALIERDRFDATARKALLRERDGAPTFLSRLAAAVDVPVPLAEAIRLTYSAVSAPRGRTFATYPAHLVATLPEHWIQGRVALIGVDLQLEDRHRTPFAVSADTGEADMPGVLIHAFALQQLIDRTPDRTVPGWIEVATVLTAAAIGALLGSLTGSGRRFAVALVVLATGYLAVSFSVSSLGGPLLPIVAPLLAFLGAGTAALVRRWHAVRRHAAFLRSAFSHFLAPTVVDALVADPGRLRLGGERRELSFLFTDIAGFTTLAERMSPEPLLAMLNRYLDGVIEIVTEEGGTIDKLVGDAVHVMFNAPLIQPDHARRAVRCALRIDAFCREFERRMLAEGIPLGPTRIGVHTGETVVGNMGGSVRFDYTATGDAINVAARLESANRHLGTRICAGERTVSLCDGIGFRPIGHVLLKGKSSGLQVHEALPDRFDPAHRDAYLEAYAQMAAGDPGAGKTFTDLTARFPDDMLIRLHATRLAEGARDARIALEEK
jgi:class 3 adenylate cyclase